MSKYVPEGVTPLPWRATPHYESNGYGSFSRHPAANRYSNIVEPHPNSERGCRSFVLSVGVKGNADEFWLSIKDANARYLLTAANLYPRLCEALEYVIKEFESSVSDLDPPCIRIALALLREAEEAAK